MTTTILLGDVFAKLAELPDNYFDCVVTSPPYWGLRDYGVEGQIGMEPTMAEHIEVMVRVMAEIHRVLKPEGTVWFNYGDCYASTPNGRSAADTKAAGNDDRTFRDKPFSTIQGTLKPKDLTMMPNRIAIALQDWGWWIRSEIIWGKPNPMPESVIDRPATSHEKIFLLTKSARYFYDAEAVRVKGSSNTHARVSKSLAVKEAAHRANGGKTTDGPAMDMLNNTSRKLAPENQNMIGQKASREAALSLTSSKTKQKMPAGWDTSPGAHGSVHREGRTPANKQRGHKKQHQGFDDNWDQISKEEQQTNGRNLRNWEPAPPVVWKIATKPFGEAHFATFPPELVERCLTAGCPKGGHVLDPFGGAGTTGLVADRMQINCTLIELNPDYIEIADQRLNGDRGGLLNIMEDE